MLETKKKLSETKEKSFPNFSFIFATNFFRNNLGNKYFTMEIQECSLPGFYCSRVLGLAPYLIRRNNKNRIDEIRRSPWLCFYSICVMTVAGDFEVEHFFKKKAQILIKTSF